MGGAPYCNKLASFVVLTRRIASTVPAQGVGYCTIVTFICADCTTIILTGFSVDSVVVVDVSLEVVEVVVVALDDWFGGGGGNRCCCGTAI